MVAGIIAVGYLSYQDYERQFGVRVESQLSSIAELKVSELQDWRNERLGDAELLYQNLAFSTLAQHYLENPADARAQAELQAWLDKYQVYEEYARVSLLDADGVERLSSPAAPAPVAAHLTQDAAAALSARQVTFLDFHRDTADGAIHLLLLIPILAGQDNRPLGVLVLRIDPDVYLYPFIQQWPIPSASAETLLVRREGTDVVFLNELRFQTGTALNLRFPLENTQFPAVKAVLGQTGIVEGVDYRGVPVIADVRAVPGSPWFLVAKIDTTEVYAPLRERLWQTESFFGVLIVASGAALGLVWWHQRLRYYRGLAAAAQSLRESEALLRTIAENYPNSYLSIIEKDLTVGFTSGQEFKKQHLNPDEFVGMTLEQVFGDQTPVVREHYLRTFAGKEQSFELFINDQHQFYRTVPLYAQDGTITRILSVVENITERKRAEEALRATNELLSLFIKDSPIFAYIKEVSPTESRVLKASENYQEMVGIPGSEMVGMTMEELFPAEFAAKITADDWAVVSGGKTLQLDEDLNGRNYTTVKFPIFLGGKNLLAGYTIDITERKQAEEALRESEAKYKMLFVNAAEGILVADLKTKQFRDANPAMCRMLGYTKEELIHLGVADIHPKDSLDHVLAEFEAQVRGEKTLASDLPCLSKNGALFYVDIKSTAMVLDGRKYNVSFFTDITERKQMVETLQESQAQFRDLYENAPNAYFSIGVDGYIRRCNRRAAEMLGYAVDELIGQSRLRLYVDTPQGKEKALKVFQRFLAGETVIDEELQMQQADGTLIWVSLTMNAIRDAQGQVVESRSMVVDITERKLAEGRIKAALEEKEALLREVHHRVKNNMQVISSLLNLQEREIKDEKYSEMLKESRDRIKSMSLVHEKLYQSVNLADIDLGDYIKSLATSLFRSYGTKGKIALQVDCENVRLPIDSAIPCGLIINELISNSLKHAFPEDPPLPLQRRGNEINISLRSPGDEIELVVSDNGVGIPDGLDFRNTASLGLHLVTILAEGQLHGKIELERTAGTSFRIRFDKKGSVGFRK